MSAALDLERQIDHLLDVERHEDARRILSQPLREDPESVDLLYLAARVEFSAERGVEAERWVGEVLQRAPTHLGARVLRSQLCRAAKRYQEAEAELLGLLREVPESGRLYALYAQLMLETIHVDKARALVDEALRLDPEDRLAKMLDVTLSIVQGRLDLASVRVSELVREAPEAESVAWTLFELLRSQHRYREAVQVARELLRARPSDPDTLEALVDMRVEAHWSSLPLWPFQRWGWDASIALWFVSVGVLCLLSWMERDAWVRPLAVVCLIYVIYSWVQPPLLKRWLRWRGF